jgi:cyclohexyl-isocyanide hydratase
MTAHLSIRIVAVIPVCRTRSAIGNPNSACFKTATICSTKNRFLFMANLPFHHREIRQRTNINHGPLFSGRLSAFTHDMSKMPSYWTGKERIAYLIYPGFTALDMVGPQYMLGNLMEARLEVVAKTLDPVRSDTGLVFTPSIRFEDVAGDIDILCVPGGSQGTLAAMRDDSTLSFIRDAGQRARFVTSVCTGSLLLGSAGLLDGFRATSHLVTEPLLPIFGVVPAEGRYVRDRNRITAAGVTAGLDFALSLVAALRDDIYAQSVQLLAQYAPDPPFNAGTRPRHRKTFPG